MTCDGLDRLISEARKTSPDTARLEEGFEARVLARIRADAKPRLPWAALAWRLAPVFVAFAIVLGIWNFASEPARPYDLGAAIAGGYEDSELAGSLSGE